MTGNKVSHRELSYRAMKAMFGVHNFVEFVI